MKKQSNIESPESSVVVASAGAEREQMNVRIQSATHKAVRFTATFVTDITKDQIAEDALAYYFGKQTPEIVKRRKRVLSELERARKELQQGKLPFEAPCPQNNNAVLTSRGDSAKLRAASKLDGVVAQLVEHHNGIVVPGHKSLSFNATHTKKCAGIGTKKLASVSGLSVKIRNETGKVLATNREGVHFPSAIKPSNSEHNHSEPELPLHPNPTGDPGT